MFAWLRHKLFGTEFIRAEYGYDFYTSKVHYTADGIPWINRGPFILNEPFVIPFGKSYELGLWDNPRWFWVYKKTNKCDKCGK